MRGWVFMVCWLAVLLSPRFFAASVTTAFEAGAQGGVIVEARVNGAGPFRMLLDTGATHSAITEDVVEAAGARAVARTVVVSATGGAIRAVASLDRIEVGPIVRENILPSVAPRGAFGEGIHGLFGQDVLSTLRYTLDFKRQAVEWHDGAAMPAGPAFRLAFEQGRFLLTLPQGATTLRMVPDSGAGGIVLFRELANASDTGSMVELSTAEGCLFARQVRVRMLRVGDHVLRNVMAVRVDRPDLQPAEGDGLLPLHLFERVTFDGPGRTLTLGRIRGPAS
jgi:clan AA aspartic protease (TIGR02281 family)